MTRAASVNDLRTLLSRAAGLLGVLANAETLDREFLAGKCNDARDLVRAIEESGEEEFEDDDWDDDYVDYDDEDEDYDDYYDDDEDEDYDDEDEDEDDD